MWRTNSGPLNSSRASVPPKPLALVANSVLCQAEKLSSWVQPCQEVVSGQALPLAFRSSSSC